MNKLTELINNYSKIKHLEIIPNCEEKYRLNMKDLKPIYSGIWEENKEIIPYIEITHLLDSYYCLPERPDMAFFYLWKSINNSYNKLHFKSIQLENLKYDGTDSGRLDLAIKVMERKMNESFVYNKQKYTIETIIGNYMEEIPIKTMRFVSNYILKGIVIQNYFNDNKLEKIYLSSQYKTFKAKFPAILDVIKRTYGESAIKIYNVVLNKSNWKYEIESRDKCKSRAITHSLAKDLKRLITKKTVSICDSAENKYEIGFQDTYEYLLFIFNSLMYAIRNSSIHGNEASRLNSETANISSVESNNYIYLLGHLFLSLELYLNDEIVINDLYLNIENMNLLIGRNNKK